jgi:hypothetical protein
MVSYFVLLHTVQSKLTGMTTVGLDLELRPYVIIAPTLPKSQAIFAAEDGKHALAILFGIFTLHGKHVVSLSRTASMDTNLEMTAAQQLQSTFFGLLPREIRDMVYTECWNISGQRQHVFEHEGVLTHSRCVLKLGEEDTRNQGFERLWNQHQARGQKGMVRDGKWARRMASTWNEHWRCEEAMRAARENGRGTYTLFLPCLLACRRM